MLWDPGAGGARKENGRFMVSNRLYTRIIHWTDGGGLRKDRGIEETERQTKKSDFSAKRKIFRTRVQLLARNTLNGGIREGFGLNADSQGFLGIPGRLARNPPGQIPGAHSGRENAK